MSTKIYYGFRFNHNNPVLATKQLLKLQEESINFAVTTLNDIIIDNKLTKEDYEKLLNSVIINDYKFEIGIRFLKNKILGIPFFNRNDLNNLLRKKKWYIEYGYWDNVDPPEDISEEEWDNREKEWSWLKGYGRPVCKDMYIFDIINPIFDLSWYSINSAIEESMG